MNRESDRKCVNHARVHASVLSRLTAVNSRAPSLGADQKARGLHADTCGRVVVFCVRFAVFIQGLHTGRGGGKGH